MLIWPLAIAFVVAGCDSVGPGPPYNEFYFQVVAQDSTGTPVPNLRVSVWNRLSISRGSEFNGRPTSTIRFALDSACDVDLLISMWESTPLDTLVDALMPPGVREVVFGQQCGALVGGTRLLDCRIIARDPETQSVLFEDSIIPLLHRPDPDKSVIGWTSQQGVFETTEKSLFPHLLDPGPLVHTVAGSPDSVGEFTVLDTVSIALTDTTSGLLQTYKRAVVDGPNEFVLLWDPVKAHEREAWHRAHRGSANGTAVPSASRTIRVSSEVRGWMLYQNYPNPFN